MRCHSILDYDISLRDVRQRIMNKISMPTGRNGCWLWTGAKHKRAKRRIGHGFMGVAGVKMYVHVVLFEIRYRKKVPKNRVLRHTCNVAACCNPKHLKPGSQKRNVRDAVESGSHWSPRGETHHCARLTQEKARRIRELGGHETQATIATLMGVGKTAVGRVLRGETWKE